MPQIQNREVFDIDSEILQLLDGAPKPMAALPPCAEVLLALQSRERYPKPEQITEAFQDYFAFVSPGTEHVLALGDLGQAADLYKRLDPDLRKIIWQPSATPGPGQVAPGIPWEEVAKNFPPQTCEPLRYVALRGMRQPAAATHELKRLFVGDLVWLYFFERSGTFKILNRILTEYSTRGGFPFPNGMTPPAGSEPSELLALVLEAMVRETKSGLSSTLRDREGCYRRVLGWSSEAGERIESDAIPNMAFSLFHKLVQSALRYFKDKRIADTIQTAAQSVSVSTLAEIADTIRLLKVAFRPFDYGRAYTVTLTGILWLVAGLTVIREAKTYFGVPAGYLDATQYIPAAYDILVENRSVTPSKVNRYMLNRNCARYARRLLLAIDGLNPDLPDFAIQWGFLEQWLLAVEADFEGYRNSYRALTGIELGQAAEVQQVALVRR